MIELNIQHPAHTPSQDEVKQENRDFSIEEITKAFKNMQSEATTGPSGTIRSFFLWLISMIPNLFTKGLDEYLNHFTDDEAYEWIKKQ